MSLNLLVKNAFESGGSLASVGSVLSEGVPVQNTDLLLSPPPIREQQQQGTQKLQPLVVVKNNNKEEDVNKGVVDANKNSDIPPPPALKRQVTAAEMKKMRKVRFNPYVHRLRLPEEEAEEAQKARKSKIKEAPYHDEIWDGDTYGFREKELTVDELWTLKMRQRMGSIPKKIAQPIKKGLKALQFFVPGSEEKDVDTVSAHASKIEGKKTSSSGSMDEEDSPAHNPGMKKVVSRKSMSQCQLELEINKSIFLRHDELCEIINRLKTAPGDLETTERRLALFRAELSDTKEDLRRLRFELPELERKLSRNANPRLLHYMQFSRDEKVKRLEHEYEKLRSRKDKGQKQVEKLAMQIYEENEKLEQLGNRLSELRAAEAELEDIETVVVREFGKSDLVLARTMEAMEDVRKKIEKENQIERKLKQSVETIKGKNCLGKFLSAQEALIEAENLLKQTQKSTLDRASLKQTPFVENSLAAVKRRETLNKARECSFSGLECLEVSLDDIEESCKEQWSASVLDWRREIPLLHHPELFGVLKRSTSGEIKLDSDQEITKMIQRLKRKLAAINRLIELSNRYAEFFQREISRTMNRLNVLQRMRKDIEIELEQKRKVVFLAAKASMIQQDPPRMNEEQQQQKMIEEEEKKQERYQQYSEERDRYQQDQQIFSDREEEDKQTFRSDVSKDSVTDSGVDDDEETMSITFPAE